MKKLLTALTILSFILPAYSLAPDTSWSKVYTASIGISPQSVRQTSDGGYIICAKRTTQNNGADLYLLKTDAGGDSIWSVTIGGPLNDYPRFAEQTFDGGYITCGNKVVQDNESCLWYVKTDEDGNIEWESVHYGTYLSLAGTVKQTVDGGYIMVGGTHEMGQDHDIVLWKVDSLGVTEWYHRYFLDGWDGGNWVEQTTDGGYVVAGEQDHDIYVMKTNPQGQINWQYFSGGQEAYCVQVNEDNTYMVSANMGDHHLIKLDYLGLPIWTSTIDMPCGFIQSTFDKGYIHAGREDNQIVLIKSTHEGELEWTTPHNCSTQQNNAFAHQTADGGFVAVCQNIPGASSIRLVKYDPEKKPFWLALSPVSTPIVIPAGGGTFDYQIRLTNYWIFPEYVDVWMISELPGGSTYGPIRWWSDYLFNGHLAIDRIRTQSVPAAAPAGEFTYRIKVGAYPDVVWIEDSLYFEKLDSDDGIAVIPNWNSWDSKEAANDDYLTVELQDMPIDFTSHPNPFNLTTTLSFNLPSAADVRLTVFDITGRKAASLLEGRFAPGNYEILWDASGQASGVYFVRMEAGDFTQTRKLLLIK